MGVPELNDAKVVVSKTNSLVVLGPSTCNAGVPCTNDDRGDLNYSVGLTCSSGAMRDHVVDEYESGGDQGCSRGFVHPI